MAGLYLFLVWLWLLVAPQLTVHQLDGPVHFTDLYGSDRVAEAALGCSEGRPELWLSPSYSAETLAHELAHAYDCLDNGAIDGSPAARPAARPAWVPDYCWQDDAEWYACWSVRERRLRAG